MALALPLASANKRLRITNGCTKEPLWVAHMAGADEGPDAQSLKLKPGEHHDFHTSDGLSSTRFWPKMRCNSEGSHCLIGESGGPGQECDETMGCAPPIDSKFEGTFGTNDGIDWIDVSLVDGWTLPFTFKMVLQEGKKCNAGDGDRKVVTSVDCSNLTLDNCPAHEVLGDQNTNLQVIHPGKKKEVVGCYSPCAKLTSNNWGNSIADGVSTADDAAVPYCCPTPPMSPEDCRAGPVEHTNFVRAVHKHCPGVYGYSYDDGMGLITCPKDTKYEMIYFCPEGESKPNSHGKKPTPHGGHKNGSHGDHGGNRSNATTRKSTTTTTKATSSSSTAGAKHHHSSANATTRNKSASTDAASTATEAAPGLASACFTTTGDGNVSLFTLEQAMYMPDHEYCDSAALWRGQSTGRADCQRRCSAIEECTYYSHWLSGKVNWCRLTASCEFRGTEAKQHVSMFRRCDADEPRSTDKPREVIPGEIVHVLLKSEDFGGSIAPGGERHSGAPDAVPVKPATVLALLLGSSAAVAAAACAVVRWQRGASADWRRLQEDSPEDHLLVASQPIDAVA